MSIFVASKQKRMRKFILISLTMLLLISCSEDETIAPVINDGYPLVVKNATHDEVMIESKQLSTGIIVLQSDEVSDTIYSSSDKITIEYFGKGTYYKQKEMVVPLDIGTVTKVLLEN